MKKFLFLTLLVTVLPHDLVSAQEVCRFLDHKGQVKVVTSKLDIPARYKKTSQCINADDKNATATLAAPHEVSLAGSVRREDMNTTLGPVALRWPRNIEGLFGRTPNRAVQEAASAISRTLRQSSFPSELLNADILWNIVFLDTREPTTQAQIPPYLVHNCHPGWMTPPANIYIVAQRVAGDCSVTKSQSKPSNISGVADAELAEVLVHEFAHAIEYQLLRGKRNTTDRLQAEGFATWLEHYAATQSPMLNATSMQQKRLSDARASYKSSPTFVFARGDASDYARASMYFSAIQNRFGVRGIVDVYDTMSSSGVSLFAAVEQRLGWRKEQFEDEVARLLR